ncbi:MAG: phosphotransferase enzyme family protein [Succinivibrio sp.]
MAKEYEPKTVSELTDMVNSSLSLWGLSDKAQAKLLCLSENATFKATDPVLGQEIIIRVQRTGYSSKDAIRSEMAWVKALYDGKVIDTAKPVPLVNGEYVADAETASGEKRMMVAFEKLNGEEPNLGLSDLAHWFEVIGEITARMHNHARTWQRPEWFSRRKWDYEGIVGKNAFWGYFMDDADLSDEDKVLIGRTLDTVKNLMDDYGIDDKNFGVIHSDLRATNLLVDGDLLHVIDFDDMGYGWYLFDFAASLSFMEQDEKAPELTRAWINGYEKVNPLSEYEKNLLPTLSIMRRIELMNWCNTHSEVPYASEHRYEVTRNTVRLCDMYLKGSYLK